MTDRYLNDRNKKRRVRDKDLIKAEIAMQRAARKAREKAQVIGAGVMIIKDGQIVEERPGKSD